MAKLSVAVAGFFTFAFLFFALPIANARTQSLILPENEQSKADFNPIVRLPSDSDNAEPKLNQVAKRFPTPEDRTVESVPLRFARFRPVNRHFGLRLGLPSSRSCHHHLHRHPHHDGLYPRYGVAVARNGENGDFDPVIIRGRVRRNPPRWISIPHFHHHHHHDDDKNDHDDDEFQSVLKHGADIIKDKLRKRFHHDDDSDDEEDEKIFKRNEQKQHEEDHDNDNFQSVLKHSADFAKKKWKKHFHHNHDEDDRDNEEDEKIFKRTAHKHEEKKNEGGLLHRIRKMIDF